MTQFPISSGTWCFSIGPKILVVSGPPFAPASRGFSDALRIKLLRISLEWVEYIKKRMGCQGVSKLTIPKRRFHTP